MIKLIVSDVDGTLVPSVGLYLLYRNRYYS